MRPRRRLAWRLLAIALVGLAVVAGWALTAFPAKSVVDAEQGRLEAPSPWLAPGRTVGQTFRARYANLQAIECRVAMRDTEVPLPAGAQLRLTLERTDRPGAPPVEASADLAGLRHNDTVRLTFPPLGDSAGAAYRATLSVADDYGLALWATSGDAYAPGEMLADGAPQVGDLTFTTECGVTWREVAGDLARMAARGWRLLPGVFLALVAPGWALDSLLLGGRRDDPWVRVGRLVALSLAFWALLALWSGAAGIHVGGRAAWGVLALLGLAAVWQAYRRRSQGAPPPRPLSRRVGEDGRPRWLRGGEVRLRPISPADLAMVVVLVFAVAGRALNARALLAPAWVDGLHHTVLTRLISENGGVPESYLPYLPVEHLHYHFGFHAAAAALTWLTPLDPAQAVLVAGQALNALAALAAYTLATWLFGRRWAGVGAALVAGSLYYLPAYYVSWGRYTHLAGLVLLPAALQAAQRTLRRGGARHAPAAVLLAAGLALTHYRVLLFYLLAWPLLLAWQGLRGRPTARRWGRMASAAGLVAGGTLVAIAPWVWRMVGWVLPQLGSIYGGWRATEGASNALSTGLLTAYWAGVLLWLAGLGLIVGLARRRGGAAFLGAWVGAWFLAANPRALGLHDIWLLDNEAVVISLWLPIAVLCGLLAAEAGTAARWARSRLHWPRPRGWLGAALVGGTAMLAAAGTWAHLNLVNPVTVLVTEDDVAAFAWVRENTPPEALFLINSRLWVGDLVVGSDGGYWLPMLADRQTTLPCVLYHHGTPAYRAAITGLAAAVEEAPSLDDPALLGRLRQAGVTHVYVGARGGRLMPRDLDASPHYRTVYSSGPVRVYALAP
ncbi:MAG: hypothetical protein GX657_05820 [Chloroflexi bacterium]|nr:hypothetical protein [Chloroflexota bacterium]